jgi:hypothetical protein
MKVKIKTDVSIATIFERLACLEEKNTTIQDDIETLLENRALCCAEEEL